MQHERHQADPAPSANPYANPYANPFDVNPFATAASPAPVPGQAPAQ